MYKAKRFCIISCHVLWREFCYYCSHSDNIFNFVFLKQGLHSTPELLKKKLQEAIEAADGEGYDAILLGYGLCSNGIAGISAQKTRIVAVRAHDCITFLLGSKEAYKSYFDSNPGTYWYSPGWIETGTQPGKERYEAVYKEYLEKYGEDNAEYLMEMDQGWFSKYSNAAYVDIGVFNSEKYKEYAKECAKWLNWNYDEVIGSGRLISDLVDGNWKSEDYLIVEPGQRIVPSNDNRIIIAE